MQLTAQQRERFQGFVAAARECVDAAGFVAAFGFHVSGPLALFATVELSRTIAALASDLAPRDDLRARTEIGRGRLSLVDLPDTALGLSPDFVSATRQETGGWSSASAIRSAGRATFFTAVAADEATYWLKAARRAEERAAAAPAHGVAHVRTVHGQEAYGYYAGAGDWLRAQDLRALGNWIRLATARVGRERDRVVGAAVRDTPLREVVRANLARHDIDPLRADDVARVFTRQPAGAVAEGFDVTRAEGALEYAYRELVSTGAILREHLSSLRTLKPG